ncbi:MAG: two-component system sensor histidine kinase CreC [Gammaproteobacteria bacterium]
MKLLKLNLGSKLFILYFLISSSIVWLIANRTSEESAEEIMINASSLLSQIASYNISKDKGTIDIQAFEDITSGYLKPQDSEQSAKNKQPNNLEIYLANSAGKIIYDSRGLILGRNMKNNIEVASALQGKHGIRKTLYDPNNEKPLFSTKALYVSSPIYDQNNNIIGALVVVKPIYFGQGDSRIYEYAFYIFFISLIIGGVASYIVSRDAKLLVKYTSRLSMGADATAPNIHNEEFIRLLEAIEKLRNELELKDNVEEYIDTLAHELRTPITGVRATAENLLLPMDEKQRVHFIQNILDSNKHMDRLVTRLLELSRIERREALKNITSLNIKAVVSNVLKAPIRVKTIANKELKIEFDIENNGEIQAEKLLLEQAIGNIINNAIDFSPKGGTITIKASETNTAVTIMVLDEGPGMPDHVLRKLFTRFFSVSRPDTGKRGNGLGLRFVRKIMQLHGGEITLQNRFLQEGAEAKLRFPLDN